MSEARTPVRLPSDEQREYLMVRAAKLYYDLQRTQGEIAKELGLTRWQIGRLLTEARELGVVRIEITPRSSRATDLEVALQQAFGLSDAVVVPHGESHDGDVLLEAVAQAASKYIAGLKPQVALMGVSWGRTMSAVARFLPANWNPGLHVVLVNGATNFRSTSDRVIAVAEEFARSANGMATLLPVPAIVGKKSTREVLEQDPVIEKVLELAAEAEVVCFSMGGLSHESVLVTSGYIDADHIDRLGEEGAVGDILGRFIDASGAVVDEELDGRTIGLRLDLLKKKKRSIGIASGPEKHAVTLAALKAGYLSVLITDETTARAALEGADGR
ncbi:sugar-binding transcriptional regulator [Chelativorans alearense]|uniref:sugar-binding transcriptional regulator n=1 Tax=Chelativorans alearense TaxID=2681495 RepID=UPI0013D09BA5|nr:sugar-binding transcriptional regulator [Chelativorans alearense]